MIDLNTLISNALIAAVQQAVAPLNERIATLESANDILHRTQHEAMVAMRDRITAIEDADDRLFDRIAKLELCNAEHHQRLLVLEGALTDRVVALENNPAQGVDTQAPSVLAAQYTPISNEQIKAALQEWVTTGGFLTRDEVDALIEQSMDHHLECYDHDSYDEMASKVYEADFDEFMTSDNLNDAINEALEQATIRISI